MNRAWPYPHRHSESHQRGTKRTRTSHQPRDNQNSSENQSDQHTEDNNDDVERAAKRINRLNIEYSKQKPEETAVQPSAQESGEGFGQKYPYEANSPYFRQNELLYHLHEERTQRNQQSALHKALNSHLKL